MPDNEQMVRLAATFLGAIVSAITVFGSIAWEPLTDHYNGGIDDRILSTESPATFASGSRALSMLDVGFSDAEPDGTWITEEQAVLHFEVASELGAFNLELLVFPFTAGSKGPLSVEISANSIRSRVDIPEGLQSLTIPTDGSPRQVLIIECRSRISPASLGINDDERTLCLKIISLKLQQSRVSS